MAKKTPTKPRPTLSSQLRSIIESRGLTLAELSQLSGVDATVIGRFIAGQRDLRLATADKIAEALGLRLVEVAMPKARGRKSGRAADG
jgi:transcriptional regulator with XRE-family HTH domain